MSRKPMNQACALSFTTETVAALVLPVRDLSSTICKYRHQVKQNTLVARLGAWRGCATSRYLESPPTIASILADVFREHMVA